MQWSIISAVNDEEVLKSSLLDSPGIKSASEVILQRGFASASAAYNDAIKKSTTDLLVFVHQDMYFPEGWLDAVQKAIQTLEQKDPNWGVLGVWGAVESGGRAGYLYWTGIQLGRGKPFEGVKEVVVLDEVVLILRKSSGLIFEERLPGYHLYGADICLEARRRGRKCYAIHAFCIHNTNIGGRLPLQFWQSYWYMRKKWKENLPIDTPCTRITFWCWPVIHWNLVHARDRAFGWRKKLARVEHPRAIHQSLVAQGVIQLVEKHAMISTATGDHEVGTR